MQKLTLLMGKHSLLAGFALVLLAVILYAAQDSGPNFSDWSQAVAVGAPINDDMLDDACPFIAKNGLDLYFRKWVSGKAYDIFVSHRDSVEDPWETPIDLGSNINTTVTEACSFVTIDGHWLYFVSSRKDLPYYGGTDIYVSHRKDKRDDTGWETPKNLGPFVNSPAGENGPSIFEDEATGLVTLYFTSGISGKSKIYSCYLLDQETVAGPATPVTELNSTSDRNDLHSFVRRKDGLEVVFSSDRGGAPGLYDLWVSTRLSTLDPWSPPAKLGPEVNSARSEARPSISWDGTTLYFWTDRNKNANGNYQMDVYQSTRTKIIGKDK